MSKKFVILAILVISVFAVGSLFAQRGGGYGPGNGRGYGPGPGYGYGMGYRHLDLMKEELGLTDKQVKQIFDIGTQYREKYFENRNNPDKLDEIRTEHRKAVESVLTTDQLDKYNKFRNNVDRYGRYGDCPRRW